MVLRMLGNVNVNTDAQKRLVATAKPIPTSAQVRERPVSGISSCPSWHEKRPRLTTMGQWKTLCGIGKGNRAFAWRIEGCKQKYEERNQGEMGATLLGDVEAEPGSQKRPSHLRKCEEQQTPTAISIDREEGGKSKSAGRGQ
jgi:hypothetical protein